MELLQSLGNVESLLHETSPSSTHMPHLISLRQQRAQEPQRTRQQQKNLEVQHTCHDISFRSNLDRNKRTLEPWIIRIRHWTRQENIPNYTRTIGNTISIPKAVHIAAEGKRTSIQKHILNRVISVPGSVPFQTTPDLQFLSCRLRAGWCKKKESNNNKTRMT